MVDDISISMSPKPFFNLKDQRSYVLVASNLSKTSSSKLTAQIVEEVFLSHKVMLNIFIPLFVGLRGLFVSTAHFKIRSIFRSDVKVSLLLNCFRSSIDAMLDISRDKFFQHPTRILQLRCDRGNIANSFYTL